MFDFPVNVTAHSKCDLKMVSIQVHGITGRTILVIVSDLVDVRRQVRKETDYTLERKAEHDEGD